MQTFILTTLAMVFVITIIYLAFQTYKDTKFMNACRNSVWNGGHLTYEDAKRYNNLDPFLKEAVYFITKRIGHDEDNSYILAVKASTGYAHVVGPEYTSLSMARQILVDKVEEAIKREKEILEQIDEFDNTKHSIVD